MPLLAWSALAASMVLVGSYVGLARLLVGVFPVFLLAWLRFLIGAVAMLPWLGRTPGEPRLSAREQRWLFLESFFGNFGFSVCMLYGVAWTSATAAGVTMAALPAAVALLARVLLGQWLAPRTLLAVALAAAGIALLALARDAGAAGDHGTGLRLVGGHLLLVGAVGCEAVYVVLGQRLAAGIAPRRISALINLWGCALVAPLGAWQALGFDFAAVAPSDWALLAFYALAASVVSVWLWMRGLREVPATQAGVFTVLLPVASAVVGVAVLGEPWSPAHAAALALAIGGLLLATWPARRAEGRESG